MLNYLRNVCQSETDMLVSISTSEEEMMEQFLAESSEQTQPVLSEHIQLLE